MTDKVKKQTSALAQLKIREMDFNPPGGDEIQSLPPLKKVGFDHGGTVYTMALNLANESTKTEPKQA